MRTLKFTDEEIKIITGSLSAVVYDLEGSIATTRKIASKNITADKRHLKNKVKRLLKSIENSEKDV